jgi:hypothetical protein
MAQPIRIANCSGYFGDRLSAAKEMVEGGHIDVLTGDWLAELTMLLLFKRRLKDPKGGYASTFVTQMEQVMGKCLDQGIKVVSNAGGLDPEGCARALTGVAERRGLSPKIAFVSGDDLMPRLGDLSSSGMLTRLEDGEPVTDVSSLLTANAYLGCWGIVEALEQGADMVITGRVADASLVCGPAAWHHGWKREDFDRLAGAVVAGHVIECGAQATGGNYSFFDEVPGMERVGFPWAEVAADGSSVIGKHQDTGGEVSVGTVTSQLLYEIGPPGYLGPDVTARFDTVRIEQTGADRVRLSGVRGEPPPAFLKVCVNRLGGYRNDFSIGLTGLDIDKKAALVQQTLWRASGLTPADFDQVTFRLAHTSKPDPASNEEAVAWLHVCVRDRDEKKLGKALTGAFVELATASVPGIFGPATGPPRPRPFGVFEALRVPAEAVPQQVMVLGGGSTKVSSVVRGEAHPVEPARGPEVQPPGGPAVRVELGRIFGARSGDKGGDANLGVFARSDLAWAWLDRHLTTQRLKELLPEVATLPVERYRFPALRSLNFVIRSLLAEGVAASTRPDAQAKSLGEWLRARLIELPGEVMP